MKNVEPKANEAKHHHPQTGSADSLHPRRREQHRLEQDNQREPNEEKGPKAERHALQHL
jgi:hypothetical protein